jgi:SLT domain-containing protein
MQSIFDNPLIARINEVTGWASAVQSAWSSMQAWFNSNPLVSYVREVVQTVREPGWNWSGIFHANGGFVTKPEVSMVGEAGPEVIIPLSPNRRGRAMSLYKQTGAILGAGNGGTVNNSTTNLGGVSINVYASPTQSADEIADVVSKRIAQQVYSRGAVFA